MLEIIEKLINEHGSSAILKERLELVNDKYEALEGKFSNASKENELLHKEIDQLKARVVELETSLAQLASTNVSLPQEQTSILRALFSAHDHISEEYIARDMQLDLGVAKYHLNELVEQGLLNRPLYTMGNPMTGSSGTVEHSISDKGRKYLVEVLGS